MTESTLTDDAVLNDEVQGEIIQGEPVQGEVVDSEEGPQDEQEEEEEGTEDAPETPKARKPRTSRANKNAEAAAKGGVNPEKDVVKASDLDKSAAKSLTNKIKKGLGSAIRLTSELADLYQSAWDGRVWVALGHADWRAYVDAEFGEFKPNYPVETRRGMVKQLISGAGGHKGLSQTGVSAALGVDQKTVSNDVKVLREMGELPTEGTAQAEDGTERPTGVGDRAPRTVDLPKVLDAALTKLDDAVGRVTELTANEQWEDKLPEFRTMYREALGRQIHQLTWLLDQVQ